MVVERRLDLRPRETVWVSLWVGFVRKKTARAEKLNRKGGSQRAARRISVDGKSSI